MKLIYKNFLSVCMWGASISAFALMGLGSSAPPNPSPNSPTVSELLTQISNQLSTVTSNQTAFQQSFQGYTKFQLLSTFKPNPFSSLGLSVSSLQPMSAVQSGGQFLYSLTNMSGSTETQSNRKLDVLNALLGTLNAPLSDQGAGSDISNYSAGVLTSPDSATVSQELQVTNQLLLLNAKIAYLNFEQNQRIEAILGAQLFVNAQQSPSTNPFQDK